ncbi:1343_t:CDS:2 [Paraglomus occultum]|uniref:1343_t:CDS:1 n=1 Tax=Paraglomus occultum TaxID=144539 RepID=A0A9N9FP14_9GLOM|nr:1343_t:CDS:2 [Paraglomus occultum]
MSPSLIHPGHGLISCCIPSASTKPAFCNFAASYPLKFLSPRTHSPSLAAVYLLSYGGGLVSGDFITIDVECHAGVNLMLLTQGSTKVFKRRPRTVRTDAMKDAKSKRTEQRLNVRVYSNALIMQLPDPTTCFRGADYKQRQTFRLEDDTASAIILDWFTSGRMSRGERWEFMRYESGVDLFVGENMVFRDVVLLQDQHKNGYDDDELDLSSARNLDLKSTLHPYECFATLLLYGPKVLPLAEDILGEFKKITIHKSSKLIELLWSVSVIYRREAVDTERSIGGVVVKIAGTTTEMVRNFLNNVCLRGLADLVALSAAELAGDWPPLDQPPPLKPEWAALVDKKKLPKAPIQKEAGGDCRKAQEFCNWSCNNCVRNESDITICPQTGDWGISFDDGPSPNTPALLDFLDKTNNKVTFAVVGSRIVENPEILKRAFEAGHQIIVHTWSHPALTTQTTDQIIAEIKWTEEAIKAVTGVTPVFARPPFGDYDDRVRGILTQLGYKIIIWDVDTFDWLSDGNPKYDPSLITGNATAGTEDKTTGHISLEHDLFPVAAKTAPDVINIVKNAGFNIKSVAECVGAKPYKENVSNTTTTSYNSTSTSTTTSTDAASPTSSNESTTTTTTPTPSTSSNSTGPTDNNAKANASSASRLYFASSFVVSLIGLALFVIE